MAVARCPAIAKTTGEQCKRQAGWGTDHLGEGVCRTHGGATPIKHGLYSKVLRGKARELYDLLHDAPTDDASDEIRVFMAQLGAAMEIAGTLSGEERQSALAAINLNLSRLILAKQRQAKLEMARELDEKTGGLVALQWIGGLTERFDDDDGDE